MRVGIGYDIHRLESSKRLVLGGVDIPYPKGLKGYSDGDVLLHAICDAMLGAINEGDIGEHFPNTDPQYKDISSLILLKKTHDIVSCKGFKVHNIDSIIIADEPRIDRFKMMMRDRISQVLGVGKEKVSIKATTNEGFGAVGNGEAIVAQAVVLLEKIQE